MKEPLWSPLKNSIYREFWICAFLSNLGTWIQDVAAGWVMTHLSASPLVISLLSFSNSLPVLFLSIPAGYLADLGYRRKILLSAQAMMLFAALVLAILIFREAITVKSLVVLSMMIGTGFALTNPAFQSVLTDLVPANQQTQAVLVYYIGINITRVLGPMLGGGFLSFLGPSSAFIANCLSFLGLIIFFIKWPVPSVKSEISGPSYAKNDWSVIIRHNNLKHWVEIFYVTFCASALWALYPMRGRIEMVLDSTQYGSLLGFLGLGACVSALLSQKIIRYEFLHRSLGGAYLVYSLGLLSLGLASDYVLLALGMFLGGMGWLIFSTLLNMRSRIGTGASPLKATMLGVFLAVFYSGMSIGAVFWGYFARYANTQSSLSLASLLLCALALKKLLWKDESAMAPH